MDRPEGQVVYQNPVFGRSFPDPFVLKHRGQYWAYCTGIWSDGLCFGILRSRDLVGWEEVGGAMEPLPDRPIDCRAPEVTYSNGTFYLYYSAGKEERMHLRVATADRPEGPFHDTGRVLTNADFAVDPHVFHDRIKREDVWEQSIDGERVLPIPRTIPDVVIGPGHTSVVRGPDNRQLYCVYNGWSTDGGGRVLAIDPLDWAGERMLVLGPTTTPQPAPIRPTIEGFGPDSKEGLGAGWIAEEGIWETQDSAAIQESIEGRAQASHPVGSSRFALEVDIRALVASESGASYGVSVSESGGLLGLDVSFTPRSDDAMIWLRNVACRGGRPCPLPTGFDSGATHLLRIDCDGLRAAVMLDGGRLWQGTLPTVPAEVSLFTRGVAASFSGFAVTPGWEDLFDAEATPETLGWTPVAGEWWVRDGRLHGAGPEAAIVKGDGFDAYEFVVNARAEEDGARYGFYPAVPASESGLLVVVEPGAPATLLALREGQGKQTFALPEEFDPRVDQQFRFRKQGSRLSIRWESLAIGTVEVPEGATRVGLHTNKAAAFEMVRVTATGRD